MSVFKAVKNSITTRAAAELYGLKVNHSGMTCCPFHNDRHPSMKVDKRFHCFGCQADGDVIDFTDEEGNVLNETKTTLTVTISVSSMDYRQGASYYAFDPDQKEQLYVYCQIKTK